MFLLTYLLTDFWKWAGINSEQFARIADPTSLVEPFYYPRFNELRNSCKNMINKALDNQETDDFLTCLALDSEEELILTWCIELGNDVFVNKLIEQGCTHLQPEARWQIVELIHNRGNDSQIAYLKHLCNDSNPYVKKRAQNTVCEYCERKL